MKLKSRAVFGVILAVLMMVFFTTSALFVFWLSGQEIRRCPEVAFIVGGSMFMPMFLAPMLMSYPGRFSWEDS